MDYSKIPQLNTADIIQVPFPRDQYIPSETKKSQIVLHHTVSPSFSASGDIAWWKQTRARVATCIIIDGKGRIHQLFSSKYWAYHLYVSSPRNKVATKLKARSNDVALNRGSIGVELDSAGGLTYKNGRWYTAYGRQISKTRVQEYPDGYRGYYGFEKYYPQQLAALWQLLKYWEQHYPHIPLQYRDEIWDVDRNALTGVPGLYAHTSYRTDKSDCHPDPGLIEMLKQL